MKRVITIMLVSMLWPFNTLAYQHRVYCRPDGQALLESRVDEDYQEANKSYDFPSFLIDHAEIPHHQWVEQLRCDGHSLMVDEKRKPARVIAQEKIQAMGTLLDEALEKPSPDPVEIIRLQRQIEKLRSEHNIKN